MLRVITGVIIAIFTFLIQTCFGKVFSIGEITPNLMIIFVFSWGFLNGKKHGLVMGFFCGLLVDLFFGYEGVVGFTALIYMYVGFLNGFLHEVFYGDDIKFPMVLVAISDFVYNFIYYIFMFLLRNKIDVKFYMGRIIIPELIYTTIVAIFVYKILFVLCRLLDKHEKKLEGKYV